MKKRLLVLIFGIVCVSPAFSAGGTDYYSYSYARLSYVNGDVFIQRADDLGYEEAVVNLALVQGDKIGTREGRAEIHLGKRNYLRVDRQTQLDLIELPRQGYDRIQLHLLAGDIFLRINFLEREKDFEVHTPDASFYVLEEGLFRLSIRENMQTELYVIEGQIEAAGEEGSLVVRGGESLVAVDGFFGSENRYYPAYDDDFALWNDSRDEMFSRYVARQYLPTELYEYEVELSYSGRWVYESPYGYVWVPYGAHTSWRPYYYGRWVWYPIIGWTWISHDPWGWVVYRYGRWHWRASLGWYWIPTTVWGPAWVHWHHGYDTIGWCPLSFWNRPVVIVNNVFYGQYNDSYYPVQSRALVVIHKNQLQARAISKVALSQERMGQMERISLTARQPDLRPVVDRNSASFRFASQVMAREHIRNVQRDYASSKVLDRGPRVGPGAKPGAVSGTVGPGIIKRNPGERSRTEESFRPEISSQAIRTYGSRVSRESENRTSRSGQPEVSARDRSALGARSSEQRQEETSRPVPRYGPGGTKVAPENRGTTSRSVEAPTKERSPGQGMGSSRTPSRPAVSSRSSTSTRSPDSSAPARSNTSERKTVKRYTPLQSPSSPQKPSLSSQNRSSLRSVLPRVSSSSQNTSSRGRSVTAPSRNSASKSFPSIKRSSAVNRSSSSANRISSSRSSTQTSTPSVGRSSSSSPNRNTSIRTPSRSSSRSSSSSAGSAVRSWTSSSSKSSAAGKRSTSSRPTGSRVKKK